MCHLQRILQTILRRTRCAQRLGNSQKNLFLWSLRVGAKDGLKDFRFDDLSRFP